MRGVPSQVVNRLRLLLLAVVCGLGWLPTAHAIRPPTAAESQLKEESAPPAPSLDNAIFIRAGEVRIGLFVGNNPVNRLDPLGLYPWLPDDMRYQSPPGMTECPAIEGYYRHCIANCRLNRSLTSLSGPFFAFAPIATYLIALQAGGDWPSNDGGDPNHASDRAADRAGLLNSYLPETCEHSCLKDTKKAIEQHCPKKPDCKK